MLSFSNKTDYFSLSCKSPNLSYRLLSLLWDYDWYKVWFSVYIGCKLVWKQIFLAAYIYHVMYTFQSESTHYKCLNVNELLTQNRYSIWRLSVCNRTEIHKHLVCKRTLNHLAKLVWLNGWVFVYERSGCGFKSCCSHLNLLNIYRPFMETNGSFPYSFVFSNLRLEPNGSWFESNW